MTVDPIEYGKQLAQDPLALWTLEPYWGRLWFQLRNGDKVVGHYQYLPDRYPKVSLYEVDDPEWLWNLASLPRPDKDWVPIFDRVCRQTGYDGDAAAAFDAKADRGGQYPDAIMYSETDRCWFIERPSDGPWDALELIAEKWWAERKFEMGMQKRVSGGQD